MKCNVHWIHRVDSSGLGIMARPRGADWLEDEIQSLRRQGVDVLVSLLMPEEVTELSLDAEPALCKTAGVRFLSFPIPDRSIPESRETLLQFAAELSGLYSQGQTVAIHCRAGIGRASLIAAAVLALQGSTVQDAFSAIATARGRPVPDTAEQSAWLTELFRNDKR